MKQNIKKLSFLAAILLLSLSACKANISRNEDGTVTVETSVTQAQLQEVISSAIADPLVKSLTVSLQSGYVSVTGERQRLNDASKTDMLSFRLDLGVVNGELTASVTEAQIDGIAIEQNRVDNWNQTIANRLANFGSKNENAKLQSVSVTPEQVTMTWLITR
ncbi:MAG: hypothetical protein IPG80_05600 [Anaerolineales bacterium]|jgi:hypothetical protein|uniref:hypothetical protein n=1 Tax=Candidatus Villigracilis vicinus TaxID=3140679 RepID=UPI003134DE5B|nr:hypothetical protein [Anaerolineales bacterium]MBK7448172.1 hypothetical protein [Anaerolineales bacterium]MBK9778723.1 hypothetical protein [Anaerolineales bacterium]